MAGYGTRTPRLSLLVDVAHDNNSDVSEWSPLFPAGRNLYVMSQSGEPGS